MSDIQCLKSDLEKLQNKTLSTRHSAYDSLANTIDKPEIIKYLDDETSEITWNSLFQDVKTAFKKDVQKLQENTNKQSIAVARYEGKVKIVRDLLYEITKQANRNSPQIEVTAILNYFKDVTTHDIVREQCLDNCLSLFCDYFLKFDEYWYDLPLPEIKSIFSVLKNVSQGSAKTLALNCLEIFIKKGVNFKMPLSLVIDLGAFLSTIVTGFDRESNNRLKEAFCKLFLTFNEICGRVYEKTCMEIGEIVTRRLLFINDAYAICPLYKALMIEIIIAQLSYRKSVVSTDSWRKVLQAIDQFAVNIIQRKDQSCLNVREEKMNERFLKLVIECYVQMKDSNYDNLDESASAAKRPRKEDTLKSIISSISQNMEWPWILVLAEILKTYPQCLTAAEATYFMNTFSNYIKDCNSRTLRGLILQCLNALFYVEANLVDKKLIGKDINKHLWQQITDSAVLWALSLSQNAKVLHEFLRTLMLRKDSTFLADLYQLYSAKSINLNEDSLKTLQFLGLNNGIIDKRAKNDNSKLSLISSILESASYDLLQSELIADILVCLTYKTWPGSLAGMIDHHTVNGNSFKFLTDSLKNLKEKSTEDVKHNVQFTILLLNICKFYNKKGAPEKYSIEIWNLLSSIEDHTSKSLIEFFASESKQKPTEQVLKVCVELFSVEDDNFIRWKESVPVELIENLILARTTILENNCNHQQQAIAKDITRLLYRYSLDAQSELQCEVKEFLFSLDSLDTNNPTDHLKIVLEELQCSNCTLNNGQMHNILVILKSVHNQELGKCYDHCILVVNVIKFALKKMRHIEDLNGETKDCILKLFDFFHGLRDQFQGLEMQKALLECFDAVISEDPDYSWFEVDNSLMVYKLPEYVQSEYLIVAQKFAECLAKIFGKNSTNSDVDTVKMKIFRKISNRLKCDPSWGPDQLQNFKRKYLLLMTNVAIADKGGLFTQNALIDIAKSAVCRQIPKEDVETAFAEISANVKGFDASLYLEVIFLDWTNDNLALDSFPVALFGCDSLESLCFRFPMILTVLINQDLKDLCFKVCQEMVAKGLVSEIESCYSKVNARNYLLKFMDTNGSHQGIEDPSFYDRPKAFLESVIVKAEYFSEDVFFECVKVVYDLEHILSFLKLRVCLPKSNLLSVSYASLMNILDSLQNKLDISLSEYMQNSCPHKVQRFLFALKHSIFTCTNFDYKVIEFHRYAIFAEFLEPLATSTRVYVIKEVLSTIINLLEEEEPLQVAVLNYAATFINRLLESYPEEFEALMVPTWNTLVKISPSQKSAINILESITVCKHSKIRGSLQFLDPLPEDSVFDCIRDQFREIRTEKETRLSFDIKRFLLVRQFKGCRTEGLKDLHSKLRLKTTELRDMYHELQHSKMKVNESFLHQLICYLINLLSSSNAEEKIEAAKCLGILGASDLSTTILKTPEETDFAKPALYTLTAEILKSLGNYVLEKDIFLVGASNEALYEIVKSTHVRKMLKEKQLPVDVNFVMPFLKAAQKKSHTLLNTKLKAVQKVLTAKDLWEPTRENHEKWIVKLVTEIMKSFDTTSYIPKIIPVLEMKSSFAENCLSILLAYFTYNEETKQSVVDSMNYFFLKNFESSQSSAGNISKDSLICMLKAVQTIRLYGEAFIRTKHAHLEQPFNFLHVAYAAQMCYDNFMALMCTEIWCHNKMQTLREKVSGEEKFMFSILDHLEPTERNIVQFILKQSYERIGDIDSLHSGYLSDVNDLESQAKELERNNRHDLALLHRDFLFKESSNDFDPRSMQETGSSLMSCALHELSLKLGNGKDWWDEINYEAMWKLNQFQDLDDYIKNNYECYTYHSLNALKDFNQIAFTNFVGKARNLVITDLSKTNLESCNNIYPALCKLQRLRELEDMFKAASEDNVNMINEAIEVWNGYDLFPQTDFQNRERLISQRAACLEILSAKNSTFQGSLINSRLQLSELARNEGNIYVAKRNIMNVSRIVNVSEEIKAQIALEQAQISWMFDKPAALRIIEPILKSLQGNSFVKVDALRVYASWKIESNSMDPRTIVDSYLLPCIDMQKELLQNNQGKVNANYEAYEKLANFAHQEYQQIKKYMNTPEYEAKRKCLQKYTERANHFSKIKNAADEERKEKFIYTRMAAIEKAEVNKKQEELNEFLYLAVKYYLKIVSHTKNSEVNLFRVLSLWLENKTTLIPVIDNYLLKLPSYKILTILPQLVPHLSTSNDYFSSIITQLVEKCAIDHPHHALPFILAIANTHKDDAYSKDTKVVHENNEDRVEAALSIQKKLSKMPKVEKVLLEMQKFSSAAIQLAYHPSPKDNNITIFNVPPSMEFYQLRRLTSMHLPICNLPIIISSQPDYSDRIVGIEKLEMKYHLVGGITAPKKVTCIGTDGKSRLLLFKGQDDIRQDAVMQQVFTIMNNLLGSTKGTRHLQIRTYKVVPLSKRSGVLEWVQNTMPLGQYLLHAHKLYRPMDISPDNCKRKYAKLSGEAVDVKLKEFLKLCELIQPVFHLFFKATFVQPTQWYEKRRAYTQSVAVSSMCGYILGIGDRHIQNILLDKTTAEVVHIDFGIAFEQGHILPTPETIPFRLTRDIVDGMGVCGVEGTFRKSCEKTMATLRANSKTIRGILEVLLYDPLYQWTVTHERARSVQCTDNNDTFLKDDDFQTNITAERALIRLKEKFQGDDYRGNFISVESQVDRLIRDARDPRNLCRLFYGWQPYI